MVMNYGNKYFNPPVSGVVIDVLILLPKHNQMPTFLSIGAWWRIHVLKKEDRAYVKFSI